MTKHELKTDGAVFQAMKDGNKNFEIRKFDRDYRENDTLLLRETLHCGADMAELGLPLEYTGREMLVRVKYILHGPIYGLKPGWCIMATEMMCG